MRTTLTIDDDLLQAAKSMARMRSVSVGTVVSDLVRKTLESGCKIRMENGFPVFDVPPGSPPITLELVKSLEDEL
jgi:hypothetical protein